MSEEEAKKESFNGIIGWEDSWVVDQTKVRRVSSATKV